MKFGAIIYLNTNPMAMLHGFSPGDEMKMCSVVMGVEAPSVTKAAHHVFGYLNADDRMNGKDERSMSVGDVVRLSNEETDVYLACERMGWKRISSGDLNVRP